MYIRTVKVPSTKGTINEYLRVVESYRENGKVHQRVITDLGRKDVLAALLPQLERILKGQPAIDGETTPAVDILEACTWGPVLVVRTLFAQLGLWEILDQRLGTAKNGVAFADRAFVLIANRLIRPRSEHGLATWLETDWVCDRQGRRFLPRWHTRGRVQVHHQQLDAWYRTLDRLLKAKPTIEVDLYTRLRDLFSLQSDLVLYDITSTYFEGKGPQGLAKHGYSRDGKSRNVQVIVGIVMVGGWPIAHHVWEGNRLDAATVREVVKDLQERLGLGRIIFVGDRGMVSVSNLEALQADAHGYLVGLKRRRNPQVDAWLQQISERKWIDCPGGINTQERRKNPPRTRVQEITTQDPQQRVFVIDSDERRAYEQARREQAMQRTRDKLVKLERRVAQNKLRGAAQIGAAAERILGAHHGHRYYQWAIQKGQFTFQEHPLYLEQEKRLEGKYVIATSEANFDALEAVALYKQLSEVERGFRHLKDVLAMRPIYHQIASRVKAHIFVAALALPVQCLLERRLKDAGADLSAPQALEAVATVRHVTFKVDHQPRRGVSAANPRAHAIFKALGLTDLKPPTPPDQDETVM